MLSHNLASLSAARNIVPAAPLGLNLAPNHVHHGITTYGTITSLKELMSEGVGSKLDLSLAGVLLKAGDSYKKNMEHHLLIDMCGYEPDSLPAEADLKKLVAHFPATKVHKINSDCWAKIKDRSLKAEGKTRFEEGILDLLVQNQIECLISDSYTRIISETLIHGCKEESINLLNLHPADAKDLPGIIPTLQLIVGVKDGSFIVGKGDKHYRVQRDDLVGEEKKINLGGETYVVRKRKDPCDHMQATLHVVSKEVDKGSVENVCREDLYLPLKNEIMDTDLSDPEQLERLTQLVRSRTYELKERALMEYVSSHLNGPF